MANRIGSPMVGFKRNNHVSPTLLLLDGISGTGKTMVMKVLDCLEKTHLPTFNYGLEQLLVTKHYGKITSDAFDTILSLQLDQLIYDLSISREINLRFRDLSSILKSPKRFHYLRNLAMSDFDVDITKLTYDTLVIVVHQLLSTSSILNDSYRGILKRILCVRHPYYLFEHWLSYAENFGNNPREFTISHGQFGTPWFMKNQSKALSKLSPDEKAIEFLSILAHQQEEFISNENNLLVIDFEKFVLHPSSYLHQIENYCEKKLLKGTKRVLKREKLPRTHINASKSMLIYQKYGAGKLINGDSHADNYENVKMYIQRRVSKSSFRKLLRAAELYESRFGLWFN